MLKIVDSPEWNECSNPRLTPLRYGSVHICGGVWLRQRWIQWESVQERLPGSGSNLANAPDISMIIVRTVTSTPVQRRSSVIDAGPALNRRSNFHGIANLGSWDERGPGSMGWDAMGSSPASYISCVSGLDCPVGRLLMHAEPGERINELSCWARWNGEVRPRGGGGGGWETSRHGILFYTVGVTVMCLLCDRNQTQDKIWDRIWSQLFVCVFDLKSVYKFLKRSDVGLIFELYHCSSFGTDEYWISNKLQLHTNEIIVDFALNASPYPVLA